MHRACSPWVAQLPEVWPQPSLCLWGGEGSWVLRTSHPPSFKKRKSWKYFGENTSQQPSPLCTGKGKWKMLSLGDNSEVPFGLPRGKCLASSPHPNLDDHSIRTLQKAKDKGWRDTSHGDTQPTSCRAAGPQAFPELNATPLLCVSGSSQASGLSSGLDPYRFPPQGRGKKCYWSAASMHIWPCLQIQPQLLSAVWQEMTPKGWW